LILVVFQEVSKIDDINAFLFAVGSRTCAVRNYAGRRQGINQSLTFATRRIVDIAISRSTAMCVPGEHVAVPVA
jgi:hypothetical protein